MSTHFNIDISISSVVKEFLNNYFKILTHNFSLFLLHWQYFIGVLVVSKILSDKLSTMFPNHLITRTLVRLHVSELKTMSITKNHFVDWIFIVPSLILILYLSDYDALFLQLFNNLFLICHIDSWFCQLIFNCNCKNEIFCVLHLNFLFPR